MKGKAFWLSFLITLILSLFIVGRVEQPLPGDTTIKLVAGCQVDILDTRLQPVFTVVLNCPRTDSIRLFPLPVQYNWREEPIKLKKLEEAFSTFFNFL